MTNANNTEEFLAHYGVRGMKWGTNKRLGTKGGSGKVKEAASEDAQRVSSINSRVKAQKSTKPLSNKELKDAIERMQLEQQYSRLSGGLDKTSRQKAVSFINELVVGSSKEVFKESFKSEVKGGINSTTSGAKSQVVNSSIGNRVREAYERGKAKGRSAS